MQKANKIVQLDKEASRYLVLAMVIPQRHFVGCLWMNLSYLQTPRGGDDMRYLFAYSSRIAKR